MARRLIQDEEEDNGHLEEVDEETDEEDFQLQQALHISQQDSLVSQVTCLVHGSNCNCTVAGPSSGTASSLSTPALSQPSQATRIYANDNTDEILISALETHDPLSVSEVEVKRARWQLVATKCQADSERRFRSGDSAKADYFASNDVLKLKTRWKHLKDKLTLAQTRCPPMGTTQNGLSALLVRVEALVQRENSIQAARASKRREDEDRRRQNFEHGRIMAAMSMRTDVPVSSTTAASGTTTVEVEEERIASPALSAVSSSSSSFSGRSIASLPSDDTRAIIMDKYDEFQVEAAAAREDSRLLHESVVRMGTAIEQSIAMAADDRKLILGAIVELKNTQAVMAQLLSRIMEK